jgi:hypothetical protein
MGWHALPEQVLRIDKGFILWTKLTLYTAEFHMQDHVYMINLSMTLCFLNNRILIYSSFTEADNFQFNDIFFNKKVYEHVGVHRATWPKW